MDTKSLNDTIQLNNRDTPVSLLNRDNSYLSAIVLPLDLRGKEIARGVVKGSDSKITVVKVIEMDRGRYIDMRDWIKYGKEGYFHPHKDGLMVNVNRFKGSMIDILNNSLQYC